MKQSSVSLFSCADGTRAAQPTRNCNSRVPDSWSPGGEQTNNPTEALYRLPVDLAGPESLKGENRSAKMSKQPPFLLCFVYDGSFIALHFCKFFFHSKYHLIYTMQPGLNIKQEHKPWWFKWELSHLDSRDWVISPLLVRAGGALTRTGLAGGSMSLRAGLWGFKGSHKSLRLRWEGSVHCSCTVYSLPPWGLFPQAPTPGNKCPNERFLP